MSTPNEPRRRRAQDEPARRRTTPSSQPRRSTASSGGAGGTQKKRPSQQSASRGGNAQYKRPPQSRRRRKKRASPLKMLGQWIGAIVAALVLALIVRTFLVDVVRISGHSMNGTVAMGDTAVVTKFDYWVGSPARGDVVCFTLPSGTGRTIKRVVGLPGETIEIVDGITYVNGQAIQESYVSVFDTGTYVPMTIPDNYYLVLSDNRPEGGDSRSTEVGLVSYQQLSGKVRFVLWPMGHMGGVN